MRFVWLFILVFLPSFLVHSEPNLPTTSSNQTSKEPATDGIREKMMVWSRHLGVTCIYCHNLENFKDPGKPTFKTAVKHSQMLKVLQEEVFSERDKGQVLKVKVDCYMCHRGKDQPAYQEPPNQLTR